ncbi:MAG: transcription elongation factor GreB [Wenzhouxiangellaceae bacterium]
MGRWRPPRQSSSPYITADGARLLREELSRLWREQRPEVVAALTAAAAEGDRSENAEYIYRKKQLAGIDRRIRYLNRRLGEVKVVHGVTAGDGRVRFGAWVELLGEDNQEQRLRLVGADEIDSGQGWISVDSPMARALLGRGVDDEVCVRTPSGDQHWQITRVENMVADA